MNGVGTTIVLLPFWHKFLKKKLCQNFEILFIISVEILIKSKVQLLGFES